MTDSVQLSRGLVSTVTVTQSHSLGSAVLQSLLTILAAEIFSSLFSTADQKEA
jgi:hypothetical protein